MTADYLDFNSRGDYLYQSRGARGSALAEVILNDATGRNASAVRFVLDGEVASWQCEIEGEWQDAERFPASLWPKLSSALLIFARVEYWQTGACQGRIVRPGIASVWELSCEDRRKELVLRRLG